MSDGYSYLPTAVPHLGPPSPLKPAGCMASHAFDQSKGVEALDFQLAIAVIHQ